MKRISTFTTNLLAKWIWLASSVILILSLNSCKKPDNFGFEDDSLGTGYVDTLTINVSTYLDDSARTDGIDYLVLGSYTDPELGRVYARSYFQLRLDGDGIIIPSNAQLVSADLVLDDNRTYYNNVNESYQLKYFMYPLLETVGEETYITTDSIDFDKTDLLSASDRTQIESAYAQKLLDALAGGTTQSDFDEAFPGVVFEGDPDLTTAVVRYPLSADLDSSGNYVALHYSYLDSVIVDIDTSGDTTFKDTTIFGEYHLMIDDFSDHFTQYWADRSGTDYASLKDREDILTSDTVMLQTGTGLRWRLSFPTIKEHFDQYEAGSVIFKRIDLQFEIEDEPYQAPITVAISNLDRSELYDLSTLEGAYYVFYDQSDLNVRNNLLIKFQSMYNEDNFEDLMVSSLIQDNVERAKLVHSKDNPGIQLKVYYTILNQE